MRTIAWLGLSGIAVGLLLRAGTGCGDYGPVTLLGGDGGALDPDGGGLGGVGDPCDPAKQCRPGLACKGGTCQPGRSQDEGAPCTISAECKDGLYCASLKCAKAGPGAAGETCKSDGDCKSGLRCNLVGLRAECQPEGTNDVGDACVSSPDCFGGLLCINKLCSPPPPGVVPPIAVATWKGVECKDDAGPVKAYFRVPRGADDGDFFRLPFPNDVRLKAGKVDLSGFPTPGAELLGFDLVDRWLRYVEQTANGFSPYGTITMRFSGRVDFDTLKLAGALRMVDVTAGFGQDVPFGWVATTGRNAYVCENFLSARPPTGFAYTPGHTYALLVRDVVKAGGKTVEAAPDLRALLSSAAPPADLAAAHAAYAPLRAWAAAAPLDLNTVVGATMFTVGTPNALLPKLATRVLAAPAPTARGWVKCAPGVTSPCAQNAGDRGCGAENPLFDELHALVTVPNFQKGTAPYNQPAEGGDVELDGTGSPVAQGSQEVCASLTVPKSPMPAGGWPLVVYAHGTGGSLRSHVTEGVAARLADVDNGQAAIAVLGFDQVQHGTRRGSSMEAPQNLYFNFVNPLAARGNALQGGADQIAMTRFAASIDLPAATSPTGNDVKVASVAFWGHSQGAAAGALGMPHAPGPLGVVLSGVGASLLDALVTKKSPVNIADIVPVVLVDPGVDVNHPVLSMLQLGVDPADPLHQASALAVAPLAQAKHAFVPYGQADTFTPPVTQLTYTLAAGLGVASPPASVVAPDAIGTPIIAVPAGGNTGGGGVTAIVRQYAPSGYDGHFVSFRDPDASRDVARFLADALSGAVPQVGR